MNPVKGLRDIFENVILPSALKDRHVLLIRYMFRYRQSDDVVPIGPSTATVSTLTQKRNVCKSQSWIFDRVSLWLLERCMIIYRGEAILRCPLKGKEKRKIRKMI
jgi:hypothetical protein